MTNRRYEFSQIGEFKDSTTKRKYQFFIQNRNGELLHILFGVTIAGILILLVKGMIGFWEMMLVIGLSAGYFFG
jgi:hypothetical protein